MNSYATCMACLEPVVSFLHRFCTYYALRMVILSGRHCCLWCLIKSESMKIPRGVRGRSAPRTLASIKADHDRYNADGSNLKKAKFFNNVIDTTFFDIEVDQVNSDCPVNIG